MGAKFTTKFCVQSGDGVKKPYFTVQRVKEIDTNVTVNVSLKVMVN